MKVVFILGSGHCGSTLLDLLLDSHSKIVGVGEMHDLKADALCTCGRTATDCPFWSKVAGAAMATRQPVFRSKLAFLRNGVEFRSAVTRAPIDAEQMRTTIIEMYRRMESEIVVDSSKSVDRAELIVGDDSIEPIVIHLVRDGRAVTWSYVRKYNRLFPYFFKWFTENAKIEIFKRRFKGKTVLVRYEQLVGDPEAVLQNLCKELGVEYEPSMLSYRSGEHHQIGGNRMRFIAESAIKRDDTWKRDMPKWQRPLFTLCFGWLNRWYSRKASRGTRG